MADSAPPRQYVPNTPGPAVHPAVSDGHGASARGNPDVRYERTDVTSRGVVTFIVALAATLAVLCVLLAGLFWQLEAREVARGGKGLPLDTEANGMPPQPRLEGINPAADIGRAWPETGGREEDRPWFGYNVRIVAPGGQGDPKTDAERERAAAERAEKGLKAVDAKLSELAGKLPVRRGAAAVPPDYYRRSRGEASSGRTAWEGVP